MDSIINSLMGTLTSGNNLSALSKSVGGSESSVKSALGMGLPILMGFMASSASKPGGADMLMSMLGKAGGSGATGDVGSMLGSSDTSAGSDMVSKLLGGQSSSITGAISQKSGLGADGVGKLLAMVAPMIMGQIGKMLGGGSTDSKALTSLLGDQSKMAMQSSPEAADMFKQFGLEGEDKSGVVSKLKGMLKGS